MVEVLRWEMGEREKGRKCRASRFNHSNSILPIPLLSTLCVCVSVCKCPGIQRIQPLGEWPFNSRNGFAISICRDWLAFVPVHCLALPRVRVCVSLYVSLSVVSYV